MSPSRISNPQDATTNPSLIFAAVQKEQYAHLLEEVLADRKNSGLSGAAQIEDIIDHLLVAVRLRYPRRSCRGASRRRPTRGLSFDTEGSINKARQLIELYESAASIANMCLIKIASTWEGINAAEQLQKEGINCNLTLLFSLPAGGPLRGSEGAADLALRGAGFTIGYKAANKRDYAGAEDPGVQSVQEIYTYYKKFGYNDRK